ncbi:MAG: hypothetical protein V4690_03105 [Patescibacteria group bacterium]
MKELTGKDNSTTEEILSSVKTKDLACERSIAKDIALMFQKHAGVSVRSMVKDRNGNPEVCFVARYGKIMTVDECSHPSYPWQGDEKFVCQMH